MFLALVVPNLLLFAIFTYWPLIYSTYLSFTRWDMLSPVKTWMGLDNYAFLLGSPGFGGILWHTLYFTLGSVGSVCVVGLALALLLNQNLKGRNRSTATATSPCTWGTRIPYAPGSSTPTPSTRWVGLTLPRT